MSKYTEIFKKAADLLRNGHWVQGSWHVPPEDGNDNFLGSYCLVGAVNEARGVDPNRSLPKEVRMKLAKTIYGETEVKKHLAANPDLGGSDSIVYSWNDANGRTADEVIELLEKAAE